MQIQQIVRQLCGFVSAPKTVRRLKQRPTQRLGPEQLEARLLLTIDVWTGASSNLWSDGGNWQDGTAPSTGTDLVFPANATNKTAVYDSGLGVSAFGSIDIQGSGYDISTSFSSSLILTSGLSATYESSISNFDISFEPGNGVVSVSAGATLEAGGVIGGSSGLMVSGGGTLETAGTSSNTYSGTTTVDAGTTLVLEKSGATAVPGNLSINATGTVRLAQSDQISDSSDITMLSNATLNLNNFDETIGTLNLTGATVSTGAGMIALSGDVTSNSASNTSVISGKLDLGGATRTFTVGNNPQLDPDLSITADISGTGAGITLAGANCQFLLSGNNTYDGTTTIAAGAIEIASNKALGASSAGTVVNSGCSLALLGNIAVQEPITINGAGFGGLGAIFNGSGSNAITGAITLGSSSSIGALRDRLTLSGVISDGASSFTLTKVWPGTVTLAGANTYDGGTSISSGVLEISHSNALGTGSASVNNGASLALSGGITVANTLDISGVPVANLSKIMNASGDNMIQGGIGITGGNNVAFDVAGGTTLTASGVISGARDFDKNGTGTLILSGTNTHTGNVNVGDGSLIVSGSLASSNSVFSDGILGGSGSLPAVTISSIGTLAPGSSPGQLNTGSLAFSDSGSTYSVELNGTTAGTEYDQTNVTGTVDLNGATLSVSLGFAPSIGSVFTIISNDSSDTVTGTFNGLAEGATFTIGNVTFQLSYIGGDGNDVDITVVGITTTWTGLGGNNNWTTGANWDTGSAPVANSDLVFAGNAARLTSVNDFAAGTSFKSITIAGSGFAFSGNSIQLQNGVITTYSSGSSTLGVSVNMTADQAVDVAAGGTLVISAAISGAYAVTKTGAGTLSTSALSSYSGGTHVDAGILNLTSASSLLGSGRVTVTPGATLGFNGSASLPNKLTIGGTGFNGQGALRTYGNSSSDVLTGAMTLTSDLFVFIASQSQFAFNGAISGSYAISTSGGGTLSMAGSASNTFGGAFTQANTFVVVAKSGGAIAIPHNLVVQSGTFLTQRDEQIADTATLIVNTGSEFDLLNANETVGGLEFNGGIITSNSSVLSLAAGGTITANAASQTAGLLGTLDLNGGSTTITVADGSAATDLSIIARIQNGSLVKEGAGKLRLTPSVSNTYAGGTVVNAGAVEINKNSSFGTGAATIASGASLDLNGNITLANSLTISGVPELNRSKINSVSGNNTIQGDIAITGGNNVAFDVASGTTLTVSGVISGSRDFDKNNTGTLVLLGTNTNTGNVNVGDGTLLVNGSLATSNSVFVDGVLGGSGTVSAVTVSGIGTLAAGSSPGLLQTGNLTFQTGSAYSVELNGTTAGTQYDQTGVTGTVDLSNAMLSISLGFVPSAGDSFTIINNDGSDAVSGTFDGLAEGESATIGQRILVISYAGGDGNDVVLTVLGIPTVLGPSASTVNQRPTFTWTSVPGAAQYTVLVQNDGTGTTALLISHTGTSYTPTADLGIGRYRVSVRAVTASGASSAYSTTSAFQITTPGLLSVSARLQVTATPTVSWTPLAGAVKYDLWINNLSTGVPQFVRDVNVTGSSWTSPSDLPIGKYRAWIRGIDAGDVPATWSRGIDFVVIPRVVPTAIAAIQSTSTPTISWISLSGAARYDLWIDNRTTGTSQYVREQNLTTTSWTSPTNMPIGVYRFWIRGIDANGVAASWCFATDFKVATSPQTTSPLQSTFNRKPLFTWFAVNGAAGYELQVRNLSTGVTVYNQKNITTVNWTPPANLPAGTYRWWVIAVGTNNVRGLWSAPVDFAVGGTTRILTPTGSTTNTKPAFSWNPVDGATRYELWVTNTTTNARLLYLNSLNTTAYTPTADIAKGNYRAWVRAVSTTGETAVWSAPIDFVIAKASSCEDSNPLVSVVEMDFLALLRASSIEVVPASTIASEERRVQNTGLGNASYVSQDHEAEKESLHLLSVREAYRPYESSASRTPDSLTPLQNDRNDKALLDAVMEQYGLIDIA